LQLNQSQQQPQQQQPQQQQPKLQQPQPRRQQVQPQARPPPASNVDAGGGLPACTPKARAPQSGESAAEAGSQARQSAEPLQASLPTPAGPPLARAPSQ
jgi:hypothetical protein